MDNFAPPTIITAIADPEFEGMVSGALFSQGWNVIARPLDLAALESAILTAADKKLLIIFSVDFPGLTAEMMQEILQGNSSYLGFSDANGYDRDWPNVSLRPSDPNELVAFIRSNIRVSSIRKPLLHRREISKCKVIAIGSAGHSSGTTTLSINLAQEIALLGYRTLIIDANFQAPATAILLDLHKISDDDTWRDISDNLSAFEFDESNISDFAGRMNNITNTFDYLLIDLGSLRNLAHDLTDRRWGSIVKIWAGNFANHIFITSTDELLSQSRLKELKTNLANISLAPKISVISIASKEENWRQKKLSPSDLPPWIFQIRSIPFEPRACLQAEKDRSPLVKINSKSALRKAIFKMAAEITE